MRLTEQQYQALCRAPEWAELQRVLAELTMVSQAPTQNLHRRGAVMSAEIADVAWWGLVVGLLVFFVYLVGSR